MEWLETIFKNEEITDKMEAIKKELPKHFAKKTDFNAKTEELKATLEQMGALQTQVENLSNSGEEVETLKEQLKNINTDFETFKNDSDKRVLNMQKKQAIERGLNNAGVLPEAIDLLTSQFNIDELQLDSKGNIVDWEEHLNPIKEARKPLFATTSISGNEPYKGKNTPLATTNFKELTSEQRMELKEQDPQKYTQMRDQFLNK